MNTKTSRSVRWEPPIWSVEVGGELAGFCYTEHGRDRKQGREIDEEQIRLAIEAPSACLGLSKKRYEFQRQFGDDRLRVIAKVVSGWVHVISVYRMAHHQVVRTFIVGTR
jgi:hypothetical protein